MNRPRPFRLGITGGIASGKSTVMSTLGDLGAELIDADRVYHDLIEPGQPLNDVLVERWGGRVRLPDGRIDRRALGSIVFSDPAQLAELDRLTHPAIRRRIDDLFDDSSADVVAIDAVKLIESGHADRCDSVWLVLAGPQDQVTRLVSFRGLSREDAERRVAAQPDVERRMKRADVVIRNDGTVTDLERRVHAAWQQHVASAVQT